MIKITLSDRTEEIYNSLPKKYAEIILNSILARSIENGLLIEEASIFLNNQSLSEVVESLQNNTQLSVPKTSQKIIRKKITIQTKEDNIIKTGAGEQSEDEKEGMETFANF
jgi:hypothetical protein